MTPLLSVENLVIHAERGRREIATSVVQGVSFDVSPGEVVGVIGESGSGKSTIGLASLGYIRPGLKIAGGSVNLLGRDLLAMKPEALRGVRGAEGAYIPQSAAAAFNPALSIGRQVVEASLIHGLSTGREAWRNAGEAYQRLGLPDHVALGYRYPHEVSGGQLQRLAAAMAFSTGPKFVVFDEPTTALDVTTQIGVLHAFRETLRQHQAAALYISHDLAVVAQLADRILVLSQGRIVEQGPAELILNAPSHDITKTLLGASRPATQPTASGKAPALEAAPLLALHKISAGYGRRERLAIQNIDLEIGRGEIVAIVGESGSGKSTLARVAAGLLPPSDGEMWWDGQKLQGDVKKRGKDVLRRMQIVLQAADTALNPRHRVSDILMRPLVFYSICSAAEQRTHIENLLEFVSLPTSLLDRHTTDLSGGQKQRLNLARALAAQPDLLICDEVTSALDVVTRQEIVNLLRRLRDTSGTSFMFITHDLSTASILADRIVVMSAGRIVERGDTDRLVNKPVHPYTRQLLSSIPVPRKGWLDEAFNSQRNAERHDG